MNIMEVQEGPKPREMPMAQAAKKAAEADIMVGAGHIITAEAAEDQHISAVCPAV